MKTLLKTICDSAFNTAGSNNLNIIGIFEHINAPSFPTTHMKMTFVWSIEGGEPKKQINYYFNIEDPDGNTIVDKKNQPAQAKISPNGKINLIFVVFGVQIPKPGKYIVNLFADELNDSLEFYAQIPPVQSFA